MAEVTSYTKLGEREAKAVVVSDAIFAVDANHELVSQAYRMYLANARVAGASTLTRGLVRGGGKKPWRQKGTGRARVGSTRVPNWRHGGVVFGPTGNENHTFSMNVKAKRLAIRHALSLRADALVVLETFDCPEGRVKPTVQLLSRMGLTGKILMAVAVKDDLVIRATRNVAGLKVVSATYLNVHDIMNADHLVITRQGLDMVNAWLGDAE